MSARKLAWRKLLSDPPSAWMRLPVITRGVGDEILRAVDSSGEIDCGTEPPEKVVCRLTAAHPRERRRIVEAVAELAAAGFVRIEARGLGAVLAIVMPDLSLARAPSKASRPDGNHARSGREADVERTWSGPEANVERTRSGPEVEPNHAEAFNSGPVEEKREEEKRTEEIISARGEALESGGGALMDAARRALLRGYQERYELAFSDAWMGASRSFGDVGTCAAWAIARGSDELQRRVDALLDGAFRDEWMRTNRVPWGALARDPSRYAAPPSATHTPSRSSRASGYVALRMDPASISQAADFEDADIPIDPQNRKVIRYG